MSRRQRQVPQHFRHQPNVSNRSNFADPLSNFTEAERTILSGDPPSYSQEDIDADSEYDDLKCPISQLVPAPDEMVVWMGKIYDSGELSSFLAAAIAGTVHPRNPLTRAPLSQEDLQNNGTPLTAVEKQKVRKTIESYESREEQRSLFQTYNRLRNQLEQLQSVAASRQLSHAIRQMETQEGGTFGDEMNLLETNGDDNSNSADSLEDNLERIFSRHPGPRPNSRRVSNGGDSSSSEEENGDILDVGVIAGNQNNQHSRSTRRSGTAPTHAGTGTGSSQSRTWRRSTTTHSTTAQNSASNNSQPTANGVAQAGSATQALANPLEEQNEEKIPMPTNLWDDLAIQEATNDFLLQCEQTGWDRNLFRNKGRFLRQHSQELFLPEGPFAR